MIEIVKVRFKNFMSYGEYFTEVPLKNQGVCLITGEILDPDDDNEDMSGEYRNSNGAGKSSIPNAILWGLFGRTSHIARPGDKVRNWFIDGDCIVELTLVGGDTITRILTKDGRHELMFTKEGHEEKFISSTLATTKLHQMKMNRVFNLDYELFCGSVFFNQFGRGWLEMADAPRRQAMERMLRIDRFTIYAEVAKEKMMKLDAERVVKRRRLQDVSHYLIELEKQIVELQILLDNFEDQREIRKQAVLQSAVSSENSRDSIDLPDIMALQSKWDTVKKVENYIMSMELEIRRQERLLDNVSDELRRKRRDLTEVQTKINNWRGKVGKTCVTCEQTIEYYHTLDKIAPLENEASLFTESIIVMEKNIEKLSGTIAESHTQKALIIDKLAKSRPALAMDQAMGKHREWKMFDDEARRAAERASIIAAEANPHGASIARTRAQKAATEKERVVLEKDIENLDILYPHWSYLNRSYSDRRKIKSYVFQNHIPVLNARLKYYLDIFNIDINLQFSDSLSINSDKWGYDFCSGGERRRADIALMLAVFDLHESIYGRQCNIVCLDEVDGRLDMAGIDSLVQVVSNELVERVETVLIISHRSVLHSMFPRHIEVKRKNRFSYIEELR